jgi:transcriptional regulator of arginine metabolism
VREVAEQRASRRRRLEQIARLLEARPVERQTELRELLAERGLVVSRATLSRDLQRLGAHRVRTAGGGMMYVVPAEPPLATSERGMKSRFAASVTAVRRSGFVLVVLTPPGEAQLVGRLLDGAALPGVLGTVAGDDTVIVVAADEGAARQLEERLQGMLHPERRGETAAGRSSREEA